MEKEIQQMFDRLFWIACKEAEKESRCLSRQIGAVLVRNNIILTHGYNGPPEGIKKCNEGWYKESNPDCKICPRYDMGFKSGQGLEYCIAVHAERSALIHAAQKGISTEGSDLYMTCGMPCKDCLVEIIEAGIKNLIVTDINNIYDRQSRYLFECSNLHIREWDLGKENN